MGLQSASGPRNASVSSQAVVRRTLLDVGVSQATLDTRMLEVWNKADLAPHLEQEQAAAQGRGPEQEGAEASGGDDVGAGVAEGPLPPGALLVSAKQGSGLRSLLARIEQLLPPAAEF